MDFSARSLLKSKTWISLAGLYAKIINFSSDWVKFRFLYARIPDIHTHTHTHTPTHHIWQHTHTLNFLLRTDIVHMSGYTQASWGGGEILGISPLV